MMLLFELNVGRVTRRPALCETVPHWKVLSRNTQALDAGRIFPTFRRYFKLLTNNQNNYSKEKNILNTSYKEHQGKLNHRIC